MLRNTHAEVFILSMSLQWTETRHPPCPGNHPERRRHGRHQLRDVQSECPRPLLANSETYSTTWFCLENITAYTIDNHFGRIQRRWVWGASQVFSVCRDEDNTRRSVAFLWHDFALAEFCKEVLVRSRMAKPFSAAAQRYLFWTSWLRGGSLWDFYVSFEHLQSSHAWGLGLKIWPAATKWQACEWPKVRGKCRIVAAERGASKDVSQRIHEATLAWIDPLHSNGRMSKMTDLPAPPKRPVLSF